MNIFGLGTPELLLILFLLLLFFGKDKLPTLARSIGDSFKELKNSLTGEAGEKTTPEDTTGDAKQSRKK